MRSASSGVNSCSPSWFLLVGLPLPSLGARLDDFGCACASSRAASLPVPAYLSRRDGGAVTSSLLLSSFRRSASLSLVRSRSFGLVTPPLSLRASSASTALSFLVRLTLLPSRRSFAALSSLSSDAPRLFRLILPKKLFRPAPAPAPVPSPAPDLFEALESERFRPGRRAASSVSGLRGELVLGLR